MTCIVGMVAEGKVWMGGDSAGVSGYSLQTRVDEKVFINGEFLIGFTSSFRMGQLLNYSFNPPTPQEGESGIKFMVKRFIPAVKETLKSGGYQKTENSQDSGGTFLVGYRGQLYVVESDYQVGMLSQPFHACGCGADIALGSLYTVSDKLPPEARLKIALEAAAKFNA